MHLKYAFIILLLAFLGVKLNAQKETDSLEPARKALDTLNFDAAKSICLQLLPYLTTPADYHQKIEAEIIIQICKAQSGSKDELLNYLKTIPDTLLNSYLRARLKQTEYSIHKNDDINRALSIARKHLAQASLIKSDSLAWLKAQAHINLANSHSQLGQYDSVKLNLDKAIGSLENSLPKKTILLGHAYNQLGWYYDDMGAVHDAIDAHNLSRQYYREIVSDEHVFISNVDAALGNSYTLSEDYTKAISHLNRALASRIKNGGNFHPGVAYVYNLLGIAYNSARQPRKSNEYYYKCIEINDHLYGKGNRWSANIYGNIGNNLHDLGLLDSAIIFHQKAYDDNVKALGPDNYELVYPLLGLGWAYENKGDYSAAGTYYLRLLELSEKIYGPEYRMTINAYLSLAAIEAEMGNLLDAENYINNAIAACGYRSDSEISFNRVKYPSTFMDVMVMKAIIKNKAGDPEALDYIDIVVSFIDYQRSLLSSDDSKRLFTYNARNALMLGIQWSYKMTNDDVYQKMNRIANYMDKTKSLNIWDALQHQNALQEADIPNSVTDSIESMVQKLNTLQIEYWNSEIDSAASENIELQKANLQLNINDYLKTIEKNHPRYFQLKYNSPDVDLRRIQNKLEVDGSSILNFFIADTNLFSQCILSDTVLFISTPIDSLPELINKYRSLLQTPHSYLSDIVHNGSVLYKILVKPFEEYLSEHLIIIPASDLGYLPFETLISDIVSDNQWQSIPWLLHKYDVEYAHSLALFSKSSGPNKSGVGASVFAPSFQFSDNEENTELYNLEFNTEEGYSISNIIGGKCFIGKEATLDEFVSNAKNSGVIHLATHANTDYKEGRKSFIAFGKDSTNWLYLPRLYSMDIPSEMVVLSACETGTGKWLPGEGIISLASAFSYSGAKSLITSLWTINDDATSKTMVNFYEELQKGHSKNKALKKAKQSYILNAKSPLETHPYYWGAFIAIGEMSPIHFSNENIKFIYAALVLILIVLSLFLLRKRNII